MKFSLTEDSWILDQLHPAEWHFICELPTVAAGEGLSPERSREIMLPNPLSQDEDDDESVFLGDWKEFVQPDLEESFKNSRSTVEKGLESIETSEPPVITLPEDTSEEQRALIEQFLSLSWRRLELSLEDAEDWFSALNQARLMMNERFDIAEDDSRFFENVVHEDETELESERALLLTQYEFYSVIQSILIDQIMTP